MGMRSEELSGTNLRGDSHPGGAFVRVDVTYG